MLISKSCVTPRLFLWGWKSLLQHICALLRFACVLGVIAQAELDDAVRSGRMITDGKIVTRTPLQWSELAAIAEAVERKEKWEQLSPDDKQARIEAKVLEAGVEVAVSKAAVEPVWNLPGVAERFGAEKVPVLSAVRLN